MNNGFERNYFGIIRNSDFLFGKIDLRSANSVLKTLQIFENPNTGTAVNMGNTKGNDSRFIFLKFQQFGNDSIIVQEIVFAFDVKWRCSRRFLEIIIASHVIEAKNFVNGFTTIATKTFFVKNNLFFLYNIQSAMETVLPFHNFFLILQATNVLREQIKRMIIII